MIRLANGFSIPKGIPEDYLTWYVNRRIADAIDTFTNLVVEDMLKMHGAYVPKSAAALPVCVIDEDSVRVSFSETNCEQFVKYEYLLRTDLGDNDIVPSSVPTEYEAIKKWVTATMQEIAETINSVEEKILSVEGEYLLFHMIGSVLAWYCDYIPEDMDRYICENPTKEIVSIAIHHANELKDDGEGEDSEEWFIQTVNDAIDDMTDLQNYIGMADTDCEMLRWDTDYELLDLPGGIPDTVKSIMRINTNDNAY